MINNCRNSECEKLFKMVESFNNSEDRDYRKNYKEYKIAAIGGDIMAQCNLARSYYSGLGTKQNYNKAYQWYLEAANAGYAHAQNRLGFMYEVGYGTEINLHLAHHWYNLSAKQGHAWA